MKTTIARAAVIGVLLAAGVAQAQGYQTYRPRSSMIIFNYEMSTPLGSFSDDFVSDTSFRGWSFEWRSMVAERISAGIGFTYNRYSQTYSNLVMSLPSGGTFSGPVYRYADQIGLKALIHGYLMDGPLRPYLGVGIGGVWSYGYAQTADLTNSDNGFDFLLSPEAGVVFTAAKGASSVGLNAAIRYNFTTADILRASNIQTLSYVIGIFGAY